MLSDYTLNEVGCELVYKANEQLNEKYSEKFNHKISKFWFNIILQKLMRSPPSNFDRVLDVCCGSGFICLNIMKFNLFNKCFAIDISKNQIDYLTRKIEKNHISGIFPVCGNILTMNCPDNYFDCILGNSFLHHLPDNHQFLLKMINLLKPNGVICLTHEPTISAANLEKYIFHKIKKIKCSILDLAKLKKSNKDNIFSNLKATSFTDIWVYNEKDVIKMFEKNGFVDIKIIAQGRISTIIGSPLERTWVKIFNQMPPIFLHRIRSNLLVIENYFYTNRPKDDFSSFTIIARKPFNL